MLKLMKSSIMSMRPFTITVEGNIGCGKTTFLKHFGNRNKLILIATEPVTQWRNVRGFNLLQLMYEDTKKWGFVFQTYVQLTMLQMHTFADDNFPIKMMERSMHSARYCFVENLWRQRLLGDEQKSVLDEYYEWLKHQGILEVDLVVYLRASPEVVHKRLQDRGRPEEAAVPLSLLKELHELHEDWLMGDSFPRVAPVLVLDAEHSLEGMTREYERCDTRVREMLVAHQ